MSLWKSFVVPKTLGSAGKMTLFKDIPVTFQQDKPTLQGLFHRVFHSLWETRKFPCVRILFLFFGWRAGIYPQTFPQPVENFYPRLRGLVIPVSRFRDKLWHFSDKRVTFSVFSLVVPTKWCRFKGFGWIFSTFSRKFSRFSLFHMSFPQSVGKPVDNFSPTGSDRFWKVLDRLA